MFEGVDRKLPPWTVEGDLRREAEVKVLSSFNPGMGKRSWLLPEAFQLTTERVAPPELAAASGTMPLEVTLITLCFRGNAVPSKGSVPEGAGAGLVPVVAASGAVMVGT